MLVTRRNLLISVIALKLRSPRAALSNSDAQESNTADRLSDTQAEAKRFSAVSGFNLTALSFTEGDPSRFTREIFDSLVVPDHMAALRKAGFDHARLAVDPGPALAVAYAPEKLNAVLKVVDYAVRSLMDQGLKVIVDMHVGGGSADVAYSPEQIQGDHPKGDKWRRFLTVTAAFARLLRPFATGDVAFEQWNETRSPVGSGWPALAHEIWSAFRTENKSTTILVSGAYYAGLGGFAELDLGGFDDNTAFVVHSYDPQQFTYQGLTGSAFATISRLHWPATRSDANAALQGQNPATRRLLERYFMYGIAGADGGLMDDELAPVVAQCQASKIAPGRVFFTEYGTRGDVKETPTDRDGASRLARAMWFQDWTTRLDRCGFSRTIWCYEYGHNVWDFTDGAGIPDPVLLAAVGHRGPALQFEAETHAYLDRLSATPTPQRQAHLNAIISLLKHAGLWPLIDGFWLLASVNSKAAYSKADAMLNLKPLDTAPSCVEQGYGTWIDDTGYASDGLTGFLDTRLAPAVTSGSVATQDSAGLFLMQFGITNANPAVGIGNAASVLAIASAGLRAFVNASTPRGLVACPIPYPATTVGIVRSTTLDETAYVRGSKILRGLERTASATPGTDTLAIARRGERFASPSQIFQAAASTAALSPLQARDLSTVMTFAVQGLARMT